MRSSGSGCDVRNAKLLDPAGLKDPNVIDRTGRKYAAKIGLARGAIRRIRCATFITTAQENGA
jgi:hypothetical protein